MAECRKAEPTTRVRAGAGASLVGQRPTDAGTLASRGSPQAGPLIGPGRVRQVNLSYPAAGREPQRAVGLTDNRHLSYRAESILVNAGGRPGDGARQSGVE